uniref:Uncharacterized protein n=1 Tax=Vitrella brassicaformis TaxID=1169539 RepID=A0A7S1KK51_9ALVE
MHFILSSHPCLEVNKVADALTTGMQTSKEGSSSSASSGSLLSSSDCSGYTPQHLLDDLAGPLPLALHLRPAADMRHALLPVMRVGPMIAIYLTLRQVRRLAETRGGVSHGDIAEVLESSREGDDCHNPLAAEDVLAVGELYDMLKTGQGLEPLAERLKQERFTSVSLAHVLDSRLQPDEQRWLRSLFRIDPSRPNAELAEPLMLSKDVWRLLSFLYDGGGD